MSPRGILLQFDETMPGTWVGHGSLCILLVIAGAGVGAFFGDAPFGGFVGATLGLAFYLHKEEEDKVTKLREGKYDERARLDRVGDLVAAAFIYVTTLLMYFAGRLS